MPRALGWILALSGAYALAYLSFYRTTPLGQTAVLDEREQQVLAREMATGTLAREPYYRSPLWAGVLSEFYRLGLNDEQVLLAGQVTNIALHLICVACIYFCALRLWRKKLGAALAALLYGIYPVNVYFAGDLLDTTLGEALLCGGILFLAEALSKKRITAGVLSGLLLGLVILARGQMVCIAAVAGVFLACAADKRAFWGYLTGVLLVVLSFGLCELSRTGRFYVLPTQGGYNLYAANIPGSSGEGYKQKAEYPNLGEGENPAKADGQMLFEKKTGRFDVSEEEMGRYWVGQFVRQLQSKPAETTSLYLHKLFAFVNDHEGYNNKSYAFQKGLSPILRINPLGFSFLGLMAIMAVLFYRPLPKDIYLILGLLLTYYLTAGLFFASDRFRLPMIPLVILLAAGMPSAILQEKARLTHRRILTWGLGCRLCLLAAWTILSCWPIYTREDTIRADKLLMAQAALKAGEDAQAEELSQELLRSNYAQQSCLMCLAQARYNMAVKSALPRSASWWQEERHLAAQIKYPSDEAVYIMGMCDWHLAGSRQAWRYLSNKNGGSPQALAALIMTGELTPNEQKMAGQLFDRGDENIVLAQAAKYNLAARTRLTDRYGEQQVERTLKAWRNIFDRGDNKDLNSEHGR
jgi:hypothetical protein